MAPRPRNKANKGLPTNLYFDKRRGTYRYRRPTDGKWFPFGADRQRAIDAAKQLNSEFMTGTDLVARVQGRHSDSLAAFVDQFERDILPPRELAKATLELYAVRFRQFRAWWPSVAVDELTTRMMAQQLDALTPRASNQARALLVDIFNHAVAKGLCPDNPAAALLPRIEKKTRKRHTVEGLKAIRAHSPEWLQNAIDLALITAQRRADVLAMRFDDVRDGYLHVVQQKTSRASDAAWIRLQVTPQLAAVIVRCRDNVPSPYLIHRRPDRRVRRDGKHWTQVDNRYLTRAFKAARDASGAYPGWSDDEMPGFHEIRALALLLYKRAGRDGRIIAGHATEAMTRNYQRDHADVVWSDAVPDLDVGEFR